MPFMPLFRDARYFQIIFQLVFLTYGIQYLHWSAEWWLYLTYLTTSFVTQLVFSVFFNNKQTVLFSKAWMRGFARTVPSLLISSLGLSLLLKTNLLSVAVLASVVSISSKYLIRFRGKHLFNPSALGIVAAVYCTGQAWISPAQWGSNMVILFGVLCLGFIVTTRVQKLDVSLAFLFTFAGLLFYRQVIYLGWPMDFFIQSVTTGSLLLFSFFMITDPRTTPDHPWARIGWAMAIAVAAFYLATFRFMNGAPIWVLVFAQPLVPVLDWFFPARRFEWDPPSKSAPREEQFLQAVYAHASM